MTAETITLVLFLTGLGMCIVTGLQILYALCFGLCCFIFYSMYRKNSLKATCGMLLEGVSKVKNILVVFILIGCLTDSWRISGTIPFILYHTVGWIQPKYFVLCTFLLCSMLSFLTGTSFGTASTMGVICMLISNTAGLNPLLTGGAILSGIFFGDRCSPMSSSAQLVCSLTSTDIYSNIKNMLRTSLVPFLISCFLYVFLAENTGVRPDFTVVELFREHFSLHWATCIPAVLILLLAVFRVDVKYAMSASVLSAAVISVSVQGNSLSDFLRILWSGYHGERGSRLAALLDGGGVSSMVSVGLIVLISSSYSGIFTYTDLLKKIKKVLKCSAGYLTIFGTVTLTSLISCAVSCNQTLGTILTCQICKELYNKKEELALALENTAILLAALIPWGIAGAVPVATIDAPMGCMLWAFFLYLVPGWNLFLHIFRNRAESVG